jgi:hypothetical protein
MFDKKNMRISTGFISWCPKEESRGGRKSAVQAKENYCEPLPCSGWLGRLSIFKMYAKRRLTSDQLSGKHWTISF